MSTRFAGYPACVLYDAPDGKAIRQRIYGSWLGRATGNEQGDWIECERGEDLVWVKAAEALEDSTLEVMFVDIGQGDGCIVTMPDGRTMLIDAGAGKNMSQFLKYKYKNWPKPVTFDAFVITHPDLDHYGGFDAVFDDERFRVKTVYHSGLVERTGKDPLGKKIKHGRRSYVTDLIATKEELDKLLTKGKVGKKKYPMMLRKALDSDRVDDIRMVNANDGHLPGYGPDDDVTIQVLGPVPEDLGGGAQGLRWLSSLGKTKNGHSVVLRLVYKGISFLLGGDLNIPAEDYLLEHYTGMSVPPRSVEDEERMIRRARQVFESDFAKSCHHGSADFTEFFLKAVNAHATVVSSGDDEPHAHPRADTLGTLGKHSRGRRSLIFSTELSRSAKENIRHPNRFRSEIKSAAEAVQEALRTGTGLASARRKFDKLLERIERSISTYGAINMRTDGNQAIFAYKIERPRSAKSQWDVYQFGRNDIGELVFHARH